MHLGEYHWLSYLLGGTFTYLVLWPVVFVPVFLLLGWGKASDPRNESYKEALLSVSAEDVVNTMTTPKHFVLLEGPDGTGKTTVLKVASRSVWCPLYLNVTPGAKGSNHVHWSIAECFGMLEWQSKLTLWALSFIGVPLKLFIDADISQVELKELTRHVESLNANVGRAPMVMAAIAFSDSSKCPFIHPRMIVLRTTELSVDDSRAWLDELGAKEVPQSVLEHYPRTPRHLATCLLPKLQQGTEAAEQFVEKKLDDIVDRVALTFYSCKESRALLTELAKPGMALGWVDIATNCGESFKHANIADFAQVAVTENALLRRFDARFMAQFDQTREAFRRYAATH